jgi:ubiquitin C-terminal hydrolase
MTIGFGFDSPLSGRSDKTARSTSGSPSAGQGLCEFGYSRLPPILPNEVEFFFDSPAIQKSREPLRSEPKTVGCFTFRVLVFPMGNQPTLSLSSLNPKLGAYVECADTDSKDKRWVYNSVKFSLCVVNFRDVRKSLYHEDVHSFCLNAVDRGWPELLSHADLTVESGWVNSDGKICIRASACVRQADSVIMLSDYNTRKETNYIGLKNHGATCYLNGLLQSYFHLGRFREIVYKIVTTDGVPGSPSSTRMSLPLALQSVFLRLESSETPVNCMELIRAFGWDSMDAFTQHDVQELARILCDKLEDTVKKTDQDGSIQALFRGTMENYIECLDIDFKSTREESFYDIPLNVRGLTNNPLESLENSLRDFVAVETLEGDNAYEAEGHGKTRAEKGIRFKQFPPVLSFQLKRFSFDFEKLDNVKLHDKFTFPKNLDIDNLLASSGNNKYRLHTVLVHSGDVHSGHYYAFVRPSATDDSWFRFDDEQVSRCSEFAAMDDNFGGEDLIPTNYFSTLSGKQLTRPRISSAYMLVYIRESEAGSILTNPSIAEVRSRVELESKKLDEIKRVQEEQKQNVSVFVHDSLQPEGPGNFLGKYRRDTKVFDLATIIGSKMDVPAIASDVALFVRGERWGLMPVVPAVSTPRSGRAAPLQEVTLQVLKDSGKYLREFVPEESEMHVLPVVGVGYGNWVDSTGMGLVGVKVFDVKNRELSDHFLNGMQVIGLGNPVGSLISSLSDEVVKEIAGSREFDDWLAFCDDGSGELRMINLATSFAVEQVGIGATIILQANTIIEAETSQESSGDEDMVIVTPTDPPLKKNPPRFAIRTVLDWMHAKSSQVTVSLFIHDPHEGLAIDGLLANGQYDSGKGLLDPNKRVPQIIHMDVRWNLRTVLSEIEKLLPSPIAAGERIEIYEQHPTVTGEGPIITSEFAPSRSTKISLCKRLIPCGTVPGFKWALHVVTVPMNHVSIRVFDEHIIEQSHRFVPVRIHSEGPPQVTVGELVGFLGLDVSVKWSLVEIRKCEIAKVLESRDLIDLPALLAKRENVLYDHLRIEPVNTGSISCWVAHLDKQSGCRFGYPFRIAIEPESTAKQVRVNIQEKLNVPEKTLSKWRLCSEMNGRILHLKDDDSVANVFQESQVRLVLEHQKHPNPKALGSAALSRSVTPAHKPLTIR